MTSSRRTPAIWPLCWRPDGHGDVPEHTVVARLETPSGPGTLFDAMAEPSFSQTLLEAIARRRNMPGLAGKLLSSTERLALTELGAA